MKVESDPLSADRLLSNQRELICRAKLCLNVCLHVHMGSPCLMWYGAHPWGIFKHAWDPPEHLMCDLRGIRQSHANTELAWAVSNLIANRNQYGSLFETKTSAAKCIYNNMVAMKYAGAEYVFILDEKSPVWVLSVVSWLHRQWMGANVGWSAEKTNFV